MAKAYYLLLALLCLDVSLRTSWSPSCGVARADVEVQSTQAAEDEEDSRRPHPGPPRHLRKKLSPVGTKGSSSTALPAEQHDAAGGGGYYKKDGYYKKEGTTTIGGDVDGDGRALRQSKCTDAKGKFKFKGKKKAWCKVARRQNKKAKKGKLGKLCRKAKAIRSKCRLTCRACRTPAKKPPTKLPVTKKAPTDVPTKIQTQSPSMKPTKSTMAPSQAPTSPTDIPTKALTESPSAKPTKITMAPSSQAPTSFSVDFKGYKNAYSLNRGKIVVSWDPPSFPGPYSESDVVYDVFVAYGRYDFNGTLASNATSVPDLIQEFQGYGDLDAYQHHEVRGATYEITVNATGYGELHTVFVTAQVDGVYSTNTRWGEVVVSPSDPHVRDGVQVVGVFVPYELSIALDEVPRGTLHNLVFSGEFTVPMEAKTLDAGDIVTGFDSNLDPFVRRVIQVVAVQQSLVELVVEHVSLEDIFDKLDLNGAFEVTRDDDGHVQDGATRQLFLKSLGDAIVNGAKAIGNFVVDTANDVKEFFEDLIRGEVTEKYTLLSMRLNIEEEIDAIEKEAGGVTFASSVTLKAGMGFSAHLVVQIKIDGLKPHYAKLGVESEYSFNAELELEASASKEAKKEKSLWDGGGKKRKVFFLGPVPVEVYWQAKLDLNMEMKASLTATANLGVGVSGNVAVAAVYDDGALRHEVNGPTLEPEIISKVSGEVAVEAGIALVLSIECGLYEGMLSASVGTSIGPKMDINAGVEITESSNVVIPTMNQFFLGAVFSIPFKADAFWGAVNIADITIYEKEWPVLTLPKLAVDVHNHLCNLGGGSSTGILELVANTEYPDDAWIDNSFTGTADWYYEGTDGWSLQDRSGFEASFAKGGLGAFSPTPDGAVTIAMQPKIPPLPFKVVATVDLASILAGEEGGGVECLNAGPCSGDAFFDRMSAELSGTFNSEIFLSQPPDPSQPPVPSSVYKFQDFMLALKNLQTAGEEFQFWFGDECNSASQKEALVNIAAFLGQSMRETIIYDACDENNW